MGGHRLRPAAALRLGDAALRTFVRNDRQLLGVRGAIAVLHTHTRDLRFHPRVHLESRPRPSIRSPASGARNTHPRGSRAISSPATRWRRCSAPRMLAGIAAASLALSPGCPRRWGRAAGRWATAARRRSLRAAISTTAG